MQKSRSVWYLSLGLIVLLNVASYRAASPAAAEQRSIQLDDIMAWKGINATALSEDGTWFGYRLTALESDGEVIFRQTKGSKEYKFTIGEQPEAAGARGGGGPDGANQPQAGAAIAFSSDAKFTAFTVYPSRSEAAQLRRQRRPVQNKVGIVNLTTGDKIEVARVRRYLFSGENPGWIALHKYGPDVPDNNAGQNGGQRGQTGGSGNANAREDRPRGSDLLLRELGTGQEINVGNVADFAFDKKGRYLAWTIDAQDKTGNGVQYRDLQNGTIRSIDSDDKVVYSRLSWNEEGEGLAVLKGVEDRAYADKLYSV